MNGLVHTKLDKKGKGILQVLLAVLLAKWLLHCARLLASTNNFLNIYRHVINTVINTT